MLSRLRVGRYPVPMMRLKMRNTALARPSIVVTLSNFVVINRLTHLVVFSLEEHCQKILPAVLREFRMSVYGSELVLLTFLRNLVSIFRCI
jgi:hypothetical protein